MSIQRQGRGVDLAIILISQEPRLIREAYSVAEGARAQGFTSRVLEVSPALSDEGIVARLSMIGGHATALGTTSETLDRCIGAAATVLGQGNGPVLLFGRVFTDELERRKVPLEAASGIVVGPAGPVVVDFLRALGNDGSHPIAGLDRMDGDFRPRAPRVHPEGELPRFDGADLARLRRDGLPLRFGFGCPRRCFYCGEQPREGRHRTRTAHEIVGEIDHHLRQNRIGRFFLCDLVINGDRALLEAVCDHLLEQQLDVIWWGRALVDPEMPRGLYRKMRRAGCIGLELEVPSGSNRILRRMGTEFIAEQASRALGCASAAGICTSISLIVGLPGETELEFGETCAWLRDNRYNISQINDLVPCDLQTGSLLLSRHKDYGVTLPVNDPLTQWHDGGFSTAAYRLKRARELRVFVEDELHLKVVGRSVQVPWDDELRARIGRRLSGEGEISRVTTGRFRRENQNLAGVVQQARALSGPVNLEIDLTNNCNQHCAGCWVHSYLMGDERLTGPERRATLEYQRLEELIQGAQRIGTRRIQLSGAGEPFLHPRIDDVLRLIKDEGMEVNVVTNFTQVDEKRACRLVDLGVDSLTVSLWAGTGETYALTHPTAKKELFDRIVGVVSHLTAYRRKTGARFPRVKIYNVISNQNCHEINEMIDVARDMGADLIEFTPIDIREGRTDSLALSPDEGQRILDQLLSLRRRSDYLQRTAEEVFEGRLPGIEEQGEFARFLQRHRMPADFRFSLSDIRAWEAFCRRGIHCEQVYEEIHRDSAILFGFSRRECLRCFALSDCSIDPIALNVRAPYLSLQGFGSFWRRVQGGAAGGRDARVVDKVPCAIGYTYARVQATGHVIPCCKAAEFPLGNVHEQSFEEIWYSEPYEEFRFKALTLPKSDPYFAPMQCYMVCDNLGHNMATKEELDRLSDAARAELKRSGT